MAKKLFVPLMMIFLLASGCNFSFDDLGLGLDDITDLDISIKMKKAVQSCIKKKCADLPDDEAAVCEEKCRQAQKEAEETTPPPFSNEGDVQSCIVKKCWDLVDKEAASCKEKCRQICSEKTPPAPKAPPEETKPGPEETKPAPEETKPAPEEKKEPGKVESCLQSFCKEWKGAEYDACKKKCESLTQGG